MIRLRHKLLIHMFRVFDQVVLATTAFAIINIRPDILIHGGRHAFATTFSVADILPMLALGSGWVIIFGLFIRYRADRLVAFHTQMENMLKATALASVWLMVVSAVAGVESFDILNIVVFFLVVTTIGMVSRVLLRLLLLSARRSGYNFRYLLIVGASERARQTALKIDGKPELGYKIVGFIAETPEVREQWLQSGCREWRMLGLLDNLRQILEAERVDEIMVSLPVSARFSDIALVVQHARDLGIVVRLMPESSDGSLLKNLHVEEFEDEYVVTLFREQMLMQLLLKRSMDAIISAAALLILLPLMLVVAVLIKLTSPGPVLFVQERVGMNQRVFKLYKFRSMVADAEDRKFAIAHLNERDGPAFKIENDPRITPLGRFLRKTSIDELPQLFNVLSGEMSLVGPRPPLPDEVKRYAWLFRKRLSVKPGITCIWQVSGRNKVSFARWMEMDHEYIENWSLWLDMKILLVTIPVVLLSRGAS